MRQHYSRAPILFCSETFGSKEESSPIMNSNNPLAVEPETENDAAQEELRKQRKIALSSLWNLTLQVPPWSQRRPA
ncbi:MAG TPA: hypothetical protein VD863_06700 [Bradyrhizobium sp.]|jgi:hypothetical protein|nr:hypothetical protein [Bradyrhizobium sp.]